MRPQTHDRGHVGLVERRQDGGALLGLEQSLGDALADGAHPFACLAAGWGGLRQDRGGHWYGGRRFRLAVGTAFLGLRRVSEHVFLGDPAAAARAGYLPGVDPLLGRQVPGCRRKQRLTRRRCWRCFRSYRRRRRGRGLGGGPRGCRRFLVNGANQRLHRHRAAFGDLDGQDPGHRRDALDRGLVRLELEQRLLVLDVVAGFLIPDRDQSLGDRLAGLRRQDVNRH